MKNVFYNINNIKIENIFRLKIFKKRPKHKVTKTY